MDHTKICRHGFHHVLTRVGLPLAILLAFGLITACGKGGPGESTGTAGVDQYGNPLGAADKSVTDDIPDNPTTRLDASRLLQQASFGPSETQVVKVSAQGPHKYLLAQFEQPASRYTYTLAQNKYREQVHTTGKAGFCEQFEADARKLCWRDWFSHLPVQWDFFRQAIANKDQLRQRVALALSQVFVVSAREVDGSYGIALYQQMLRDNAFTNFRELLEKVTRSPLMGEYLNLVDNEGAAPNENYARELLQLFSIGTCELNADGSMQSGECVPTYNNEVVRNYAFALSGWTYPPGGVNPWCQSSCDTKWGNPVFYRGNMVAVQAQHDQQARPLLSGVSAPAGRSAEQGLQAVLDSIVAHHNVGPFIGRQLIQFLVTSNPSPAYVARVSAAFDSGRHQSVDGSIGAGVKGDMKATLAAILLDPEARDPAQARASNYGRLREPVLMITGAIRALDGVSDGVGLGDYGWSRRMGQSVFASPSVFNFYSPMQPLGGTELVAPRFGIDNANTNLARINFANALIYWWYRGNRGSTPDMSVTNATGTRVDYTQLENLIGDSDQSPRVVDALNELLVDGRLTDIEKKIIATAMDHWTEQENSWLSKPDQVSTWQRQRVRSAVYLVLSSPQYQVQR